MVEEAYVNSNTREDFNLLYSSVASSIEAALLDINSLNVKHKDGQQELSSIMEKLRKIQISFNDELELLEKNAEWEKFTIAFFGETNAGKSTIIESLRILFNESSRQDLLKKNANDLIIYEQKLLENVGVVREALYEIYVEYTEQFEELKKSTTALTQIMQDESSVRIRTKQWFYAVVGVLLGSGITAGLFTFLHG